MEKDQQNEFNKPEIDENHVINFGKYKDNPTPIKDIPANWFLYLYRKDICYGKLKDWIKYNEADLKEREKREK
jgi:uncharacterized protein (DUF3820 family)